MMNSMWSRFGELDELIKRGDIKLAESLLDELSAKTQSGSSEQRAALMYYRARVLMRRGSYCEALRLGEEAFECFHRVRSPYGLGRAHLLLASINARLGRYDVGRRHAEAALHYYTWEIDDVNLRVEALKLLASCFKNLGRWEDSEEALRRAIQAWKYSDRNEKAALCLNLAIVLRKIGKIDEACRRLKSELGEFRELQDQMLQCQVLLELGNISVVKRDVEGGLRCVREAREIAERHGYRRERVLAKEIEGDIEVLRGDYDRAEALYRDGLSEAVEFASGGDLEYEILSRLSRVHVKLGRLEEARREAERAIELTERCGDRYEHALGLRALGEVEVAEGRIGVGIDYLRSSVSELRELSEWTPELGDTELELGRLMCGSGEGVEGLEHLFVARRVYTNLGFGEGIREVDGIIAGLVSVPRLGLRGAVTAVGSG